MAPLRSVTRHYTYGTCSLEIQVPALSLSPRALQRLEFELQFQDSDQPGKTLLTLRGDRQQLDELCQAVDRHVQGCLNQPLPLPQDLTQGLIRSLPPGDVFPPALPPSLPRLMSGGELEPPDDSSSRQQTPLEAVSNAAPRDEHHTEPSVSSLVPLAAPALFEITPVMPLVGSPDLPYLVQTSLVTHHLSLGSLGRLAARRDFTLGTTQLFDFITTLDEYRAEVVAVGRASRLSALAPASPWFQRVAAFLLAVGGTTLALQVTDRPPSPSSNESVTTASSPLQRQAPSAGSPNASGANGPTGTNSPNPKSGETQAPETSALTTKESTLQSPGLEEQDLDEQTGTEAGALGDLSETGAVREGESVANEESSEKPLPKGSVTSGSVPVPSQRNQTSLDIPEGNPQIIANGTSTETESSSQHSASAPGSSQDSKTSSRDEAIAQTSRRPSEENGSIFGETATAPNSESRADGAGTTPELGRSRPAAPAPRGSQPSAAFSSVGDPVTPAIALDQVRQHFQARWAPSPQITERLGYDLKLNPGGYLDQIKPISPASGKFISPEWMPLLGPEERFVSPFQSESSINLRVILSPDGSVQVLSGQ